MPWWGAPLLVVIAYVTLMGAATLAGTLQSFAHGIPLEEAMEQVTVDPLNLGGLQAAAFGLAIFVGLVLFQRGVPTRRALALRPVGIPTLGLALVAGFALQFPLAEVANLVQEVFPVPVAEQLRQRQLVTPDGPLDAFAIILAIVIIAPASEELLFRGLMLPALQERYGPAFAIGLTSILFGIIHTQWVAVVYATLAGVLFGAVAVRTGSTLTTLVMHSAVNAVPVMLPERVVRIPGFNTISQDVYHLPLPLLLGASLVAAMALLGVAKLEEA